MSKTLTKVAVIAGAVALVATGVGAAAGAGLISISASTAATVATIGSYATLAATVASIGAGVLAKKPPARGSVNSVTIATDAPAPYLIGRTYSGGVLRHDVGYGPTLSKVKNPYRGMVLTYSVAGPLESLEALTLDFAAIPFSGGAASGYYAGFLFRDVRLGVTPETALTPHFAGMPNWTPDHKLSGKAAVLWNLKFDKDGKRFSSGVPVQGAIWKGVKVYDPRADSTYPGGAGAQRIDDEATWAWSENPGLHALAYCLGRYRNGRKVFGVGLPADGLMIEHFVELANVCDANGWTVGGVIYEPGDRWANLKDILIAGGAEPLFVGGKLGVRINAPRVALDTITDADLTDGDVEIVGMKTWRERRNGLIPKYRSEANKWDYVQSDLVAVPAFVAQDGEEKSEERQFSLVQVKDQAAQLAGYELYNGRERGPITIPCKPRMRRYGPGDMLTLSLPDHDLDGVEAIITDRSVDPATMIVTLTLVEETPSKHAAVLALTGTAPPAPDLPSPEDRDDISSAIGSTDRGAYRVLSSNPPLETVVTSTDTTITIAANTLVDDAGITRSVLGGSITGLTPGTQYGVFLNATTLVYEAEAFPALTRMASSEHIFFNWQATLNGDGTAPTTPAPSPGYGGSGSGPRTGNNPQQ